MLRENCFFSTFQKLTSEDRACNGVTLIRSLPLDTVEEDETLAFAPSLA